MSTYESAFTSLLQGVSQQLPEERLPGQLTSMENMLADPVTNLRRRPGIEYVARVGGGETIDPNKIVAWFTDIAGSRVHVIINAVTGALWVLDEGMAELAHFVNSYFVADSAQRLRAASVGNEMFIMNTMQAPYLNTAGQPANPAQRGFFYVLAGAFSKTYTVGIQCGGTYYSASYTTPSGTGSGDAALATPEYIATQLVNGLIGQVGGRIGFALDGAYAYFNSNDSSTISVSTNSSGTYIITSKTQQVNLVGDLPAHLPTAADGLIIAVGAGKSPEYYRYVATTQSWDECGAYGSPTKISRCPISLRKNSGGAWELSNGDFEGRLSGDDTSNEVHTWMTDGISGMAQYQGRLVILSGNMVSMSASGRPRRFFRSTVTSLLPSDALEVGSSMESAAAYEWAIPFQQDLILFSRAYQAVVPSGGNAITPSSATVVPTSAFEVDTHCGPISLGRTLMYCKPTSTDFFGVLEMIPSDYTVSQYTSQNSTPHLPKYLAGRCRFAVSSSVASLAVFGPSNDTHALIVHQYHWDGPNKVQQAWHRWSFPYPIATAYFASDKIVVAFAVGRYLMLCTMDPLAGFDTAAGLRRPFLDCWQHVQYSNNTIPIPSELLEMDPSIASKLVATVGDGELAGSLLGTTPSPDGKSLITVRSHSSGWASIGVPYYSGFIPSPPKVLDARSQAVIHTGHATLLRYIVGVQNTGEFKVTVSDEYLDSQGLDVPTLTFASPELTLSRSLRANQAQCIVPCRTDLRTTSMEVYTEATGELNVSSIEYVARHNPKISRRQDG